ncbi:MAG: large-conductance mechanosensitive channel protein MscL [Oscillospiraceae bacterium]|nr:large-conductance mechanosensitive channel protein MscL [Oscillospiraceae bacterium]
MKQFIMDFKEFVSRGNVMDMAVGVVVGGAFTKIINSLVENIITPFLGLITGKVDLTALRLVIIPAGEGVEELSLKYGMFLQSLIDFLIIAFSLFCAIKLVTALSKRFEKKHEEVPEETENTPDETVCILREIRDLLEKKD